MALQQLICPEVQQQCAKGKFMVISIIEYNWRVLRVNTNFSF
jgi:hypothetical protein